MSSAPLDATCPTALKIARALVHASVGLVVLAELLAFVTGGYDAWTVLKAVVSMGLMALAAALMTKGRGVARLILTLLIVLALVTAVRSIDDLVQLLSAGAVGVLFTLLCTVAFVLLVPALVLMWRKPVTRYLTATR